MHVTTENVSISRTILLACLIFFLLYNLSLKAIPSFTSGRIAVFVLLFWVLVLIKRNPLPLLRSRVWLLFLPFPYVAIQFWVMDMGDSGQFSRFANLAMYSYLGAALVAIVANDIKTVLVAIFIAISAQSIFLPYSFVSIEYREWFESVMETGTVYGTVENIYRAPGFTSSAGAALSLIQSMGVFVGWMLLRGGKSYQPVSGLEMRLVLFLMLLTLFSCVIVGRTGLLLSCIFIGLFFLTPSAGVKGQIKKIELGIIFAVVVVVIGFAINPILGLLSDNFSLDYFTDWAFGFFTGKDDTADALREMPIPPLSVETIHGTGFANLVKDVNPSGHDSGFIQSYYSMGIVAVLFLYIPYLYVLFFVLNWLPIMLRVLLAVLFFSLDVKEPFLFKYSLMFVILTLHFSHVLSEKKSRVKVLAEKS